MKDNIFKTFSKEAMEKFIDDSIKLGLLPEDFRIKIEQENKLKENENSGINK